MRRVQPAEGGEELPGFQLQIEGKARGLHECFFDFDIGFIVVVQLENDIGETFEVGINRTVKGELYVAGIEAALLRIVITYFDVIKILRAGVSKRKQAVKGNVHVIFSAANRDWLR